MRILNYIGEFFLFRWLIVKFKKSTNELYAHTECLETSFDRNTKSLNDNHNEDVAPINDAIPPISDNSIDDFNNSEELDDLDIFMRNNNGNNRSYPQYRDFDCDYHSGGHRSSHNDWSSGSYSQSYDDFHDEQDDYDMMDDDF